jgi:uncharacterized membrane protein YoaK (UPF0700 family)
MNDRRRTYLDFLRLATAHRRAEANDVALAAMLAFVAGAINAGGFVAIGQYTSHMTGIVSAIADNLAIGALSLAVALLAMLVAFTGGASCSAILINWAREADPERQYALPLALEGNLILVFGALGASMPPGSLFVTLGSLLLCFVLGLQNATITKISGARMRTTHMTGIVTDIGIELGKAAYSRFGGARAQIAVRPDWSKLKLLARIMALFFAGGLAGAVSFAFWGYWFTLPLAGLLFLLSLPSIAASD